MRLHWHRQDLRAADNTGLTAAVEDEALPVFVFDPEILEHGAPPRVAFMLDALESLQETYREKGSDLLVAHGDPAEELPRLIEEHEAEGVTWNRDYTGLARERDRRVEDALADAGLEYERFHDAVHHEPGSITTNDGDPYSVFTYFGNKWLDHGKEDSYPEPDAAGLADADGEELPSLNDLGFEQPDATLPNAGTEAARDRLDAFCEDDIHVYEEERDDLASEPTSRLSQDLSYGTIGIREVYERTEEAMESAETDEQRESIADFRSELAWREFNIDVIYHNPSNVSRNHKDFQNPIDWREDEDELDAWKAGETGYPVVDAAMRQLKEEAYIHNRARMIVGSFLTKDLRQDWRRGYEHFRDLLVDHNTPNDNGNWQWIGSTGTDAQPYFRVFNPMKQGSDYDPEAEYVARYVPELEAVDPEDIHSWHELSEAEREEVAPEYPAPIVDHGERREEAISMFEQARGGDDDDDEDEE